MKDIEILRRHTSHLGNAEVIYGASPSYEDPARYTFAHGGKDGMPYPVDRMTYDKTIAISEEAVRKTRLVPTPTKKIHLWRNFLPL